jgi:beta-galactosidase/beta-glucuronidase
MNIPRSEYPRPQMVRDKWINLNGIWEFELDVGKSGKDRGMLHAKKFDRQILVPFCPESSLSGVNYKDFINAAWYRRNFTLPAEWNNGRILINFEAVDYFCEVWINEKPVGTHTGGFTPFSFDITDSLTQNENTITIYIEDDTRSDLQPTGKQSVDYNSSGCFYTRVTGIWQTVWMEFVPKTYIKSYNLIPDTDNCKLNITVNLGGAFCNKIIKATAKYEGREVGTTEAKAAGAIARFSIALAELHLWQPLDSKLYDLELTLTAGEQHDTVTGYFGMRKIELSDNTVLINGKSVFQRLVLDQGYYPDGIYTAPDDEALKKDIELSLALGFNGARLHQKVFERRYIYWADKMGYLIWGEYGSWGLNHSKSQALEVFLPGWLEAVERDYNSPALIGWCPFNETWDVSGHRQDDEVLRCIYLATKSADNTRPVIDTSGNYHVITDVFDIHDYTQNVEKFAEYFKSMANGGEVFINFSDRQTYGDQPYFVSEYGGIWWSPDDENGWGYGTRPKTEDEFVERYIGLANVLLKNPHIFALCYTQLYDVEQEVNGLYSYERKPKFNEKIMQRFKEVMSQKAAIEKAAEVN